MRGHGLRALLKDIQDAVSAGGGSAQARALGQLSSALSDSDAKDVPAIVSAIESSIAEASAPPWKKHAKALIAAELDERLFKHAFAAMENDRTIKKADIVSLAKDLGIRLDAKASGSKALEKIKGWFYERLYERDANAMAKRATPW